LAPARQTSETSNIVLSQPRPYHRSFARRFWECVLIARFQVLLPFMLFVQADLASHVGPEEVTVGNTKALIYPPHRSQLEPGDLEFGSATPPGEVPRRLDARNPQPHTEGVTIGGQPAITGDVLRIDFIRESFNHKQGESDPSTEFTFNVANSWITRLRTLTMATGARPLSQEHNPWIIELFNDDGTKLERAPGYWARRLGASWRMEYSALDADIWNSISSLPFDYLSPPSNDLLLDAHALWPQIGPSIVLAFAAVETRLEQTLDRLASLTGLNSTLWAWINERDLMKRPSTGEQADVLMLALSGRSLKSEVGLWEKFQHLRRARNSFVHQGIAVIGDQQVDQVRAAELIQAAGQIIEWIESMLPGDERRPQAPSSSLVEVTRLVGTIQPVQLQETGAQEPSQPPEQEANPPAEHEPGRPEET
jgi:hypothetical protein